MYAIRSYYVLFLTLLQAQNNNIPATQTPGENSPKSSNTITEVRDVKITGKVIDKDVNAPLEYATVAFFSKKENKIVTGSYNFV